MNVFRIGAASILPSFLLYLMFCMIWYYLCNLKNMKNTHGGVLLLVQLQAEACNFTKSNTLLWVFFTFFNLNKWHQIAQSTSSSYLYPVDTRRRFNVYTTSIRRQRRRIDVETTSCVYWVQGIFISALRNF